MQLVVAGLLTNFVQKGKGPVVLLLHGWGDTWQTFRQLADELSKEYTVLALDLPGFGGTQDPPETWGVNDYALFVSDFLIKIKAKPYAIIAHSNGGTIAIRGLAKGDLRADKLVLIASAGVRDVYKGKRKALRYAAKAAKAATYPLPKEWQAKLKKHAYQTIGSDLFVAENLQETFKKVVTDDILDDARKLKLPTILIYGTQDTATPIRNGKMINDALRGSTMHILRDAGHFVHHDQPKEVGKIIEEFLT